MTSKNSSKKNPQAIFLGVIREKVSAFTLIYLFDMPNKQLLLRFFSDYYHVLTLSMSKIILRPIKNISKTQSFACDNSGRWFYCWVFDFYIANDTVTCYISFLIVSWQKA